MKIHVVSDLHLEFVKYQYQYDVPECDIVIAAGDIGVGTDAIHWLEGHYAPRPVFYIAGNHEYYHNNLDRLPIEMAETIKNKQEFGDGSSSNVVFGDQIRTNMTNSNVILLGTTLWSDFDRENPSTMMEAAQGMNDFQYIISSPKEGVQQRFSVQRALMEHKLSRAWLERELADIIDNSPSSKVVIYTHHAPCTKSVDFRYKGDSLNGAYQSDLTDLMFDFEPDLWIHGHMHGSNDYMIGNTRVIANPGGYPERQENPDFNNQLVVEIDGV